MTNDEIFAATNTAIQAVNSVGAAQGSRSGRKWALKQYERERADNLSDWQRQNEYNHPSSQMARLREAGLNPNLVYGKGADNTATAISGAASPSPEKWVPRDLPLGDLGDSLFRGVDLSMKQAQTDNLRVQNTVLSQEAELKKAQTLGTLSNTAMTDTQRNQLDSLFPYTLEGKKLDVREQTQRIQTQLNEDERRTLQTAQNLQKGIEEILTMRAQRANTELEKQRIYQSIELLKKDNRIKELDAKNADEGKRPSDGWSEQVIKALMDYLTGDKKGPVDKVIEKGKKALEWDKPWKDRQWSWW